MEEDLVFQPLNFNYGLQNQPAYASPPGLSSGIGNLASGLGSYTAPNGGLASTPAASWFSSLFGGDGAFSGKSMFGAFDKETGISQAGWAPTALGIGQAIMGGIQGNKAMKLAGDQFKESKRQFDLNYNAQRSSMNTELEDRQRARVASNPGAYASVGDYMTKNRIN